MKSKKFFLIVFFSLISLMIYSQQIQWQNACNIGSDSIDIYFASTVDSEGNFIISGDYSGDIFFSDTTIVCQNCNLSYGNYKPMISKIDKEGNLLWNKHAYAQKIITDEQNNIYLIVHVPNGNILTFENDTIFLNPNINEDYSVLIKLDNNGNFLWSEAVGTNSMLHMSINSISLGLNNTIVVTGSSFGGTELYADANTFQTIDTLYNFAIQFNSNGNLDWFIQLNGYGYECSAIDNNGNVYVGINSTLYRIYQGSIVWQQYFPDFFIQSVATSITNDLFCVGNFYSSSITIGNSYFINDFFSGPDLLITKINSLNAGVIWAKSGTNISGDFVSYKWALDQNDNIYIISNSTGDLYLDSIYVPPSNVMDYLIMCNTYGEFQWFESTLITSSLPSSYSSIHIDNMQIDNQGGVSFGGFSNATNLVIGNDTLQYNLENFIFAQANLPSAQMQSQCIELNQGWSMISTYMYPTGNDISSIFSPIVQDIELMKDGVGNVYWPLYNIDNIDSFSIGFGYQIKMNNQNIIHIYGEQIIPENEIIPYTVGWNLIAYILDNETPIEIYLNSFVSDINIVKDDLGNIFWPIYNINMIGNMSPGKGYQMKLSVSTNFTYVAPLVNNSKYGIQIPQPKHFKTTINTGSNMTLGILKTAWETEPVIGSEIGIFNLTSKPVGSGVYTGENLAITIWGNDELTEKIDGMINNEKFVIKIWNSGSEEILEIENWLEGDEFYETNKISVIERTSNKQHGISNFQVLQNTPNPFSETTEIHFYIPEKAFVKIDIFSLLGEKIESIHSQSYPRGNHTFVYDRKHLPSGMYFYRLKANDFSATKMMSVK